MIGFLLLFASILLSVLFPNTELVTNANAEPGNVYSVQPAAGILFFFIPIPIILGLIFILADNEVRKDKTIKNIAYISAYINGPLVIFSIIMLLFHYTNFINFNFIIMINLYGILFILSVISLILLFFFVVKDYIKKSKKGRESALPSLI